MSRAPFEAEEFVPCFGASYAQGTDPRVYFKHCVGSSYAVGHVPVNEFGHAARIAMQVQSSLVNCTRLAATRRRARDAGAIAQAKWDHAADLAALS